MFDKVLIANRGEIALRVIRACRSLGISPVCVYSQADKDGPWLEQADASVCIGPPPSKDSYLRIERIIAAADDDRRSGRMCHVTGARDQTWPVAV